jgi:ATP-dependent helicase Lhr and Lhr-like helicase
MIDRLAPGLAHHIGNSLGWRSLRPLQSEAIAPLLRGDAVLLAPTAGGKTEAAMFPLLTAMEQQRWTGTSVLYICPLKALLNNLLPRLQTYGDWLGRRVELWHGDVTPSARSRILLDRPDVLLTTPESLEAMLVGDRVDHSRFFAGLRAVVVDEVHAFAGDDRGWHLLAVLERLSLVCGRPLQRVGLSATVGNPAELLDWLQGPGVVPGPLPSSRQGRVRPPRRTSSSTTSDRSTTRPPCWLCCTAGRSGSSSATAEHWWRSSARHSAIAA